MLSPERARGKIVKKIAKFVAVPVAAGIAMASVGCAQTIDLQFPDCKTDPQAKHKSTEIWHEGSFRVERKALIDAVTFRVTGGRPDEIDLSGQSNRVVVIEENKHYQLGDRKKGRRYDIVIGTPTENGIRKVTIEATCPPKK